MAKLDLDLDDLTNAALKRLVKQLLIASDDEEQKLLAGLGKKKKKKQDKERNDLADLDEEMHGKPKTPEVEDDSEDEEEDS